MNARRSVILSALVVFFVANRDASFGQTVWLAEEGDGFTAGDGVCSHTGRRAAARLSTVRTP